MNPSDAFKNWVVASSKQKKWMVGLCVLGVMATILLYSLTNSANPAGGSPMESDSFYFAGVAAKLMGVLLLFVGGAVVLRRFQARRIGVSHGRQLERIETIRLTPRQALHLVQVGDQRLLIGATDHVISVLTTLEPEMDGAPVQAVENSGMAFDFSALFGKSLQKDSKANGEVGAPLNTSLTPYTQSEEVLANQR